jgi:hypothetical protein
MLVKSFHGAAAARAFVILPLPLIVETGILVEHPRADPLGHLCFRLLAGFYGETVCKFPPQVVHHTRKTEPGAGTFLPLVQNHLGITVDRKPVGYQPIGRIFVRQAYEPRPIRQVAKINTIGTGIEFSRSVEKDFGRHVLPANSGCRPVARAAPA